VGKMKKTIAMLFAALSGCATVHGKEATESQPKIVVNHIVEYRWNGYTIKINKYSPKDYNVIYTFKRDYCMGKEKDYCALKIENLLLEDKDCDNTVEMITDDTGFYYTRDGPAERFETANNILKKFKENIGIDNIYKRWQNERWKYDPLSSL